MDLPKKKAKEENPDPNEMPADPCAPPAEVHDEPPQLTEADAEKKKTAYPIVRHTDIPEEIKQEVLDTITGAVERFQGEYDLAAKLIKEDLDRIYGPHWHAIVGESFGYEVTHQNHHIMYLFFMGNLGILVWKNN